MSKGAASRPRRFTFMISPGGAEISGAEAGNFSGAPGLSAMRDISEAAGETVDETGVYSYTNKELCEERVRYTLVKNRKLAEEASELALRAYRALDCRDAGRVDIKAGGPTSWPTSWPVRGPARGPAGKNMLHVLELNPLAGLHPTHSDLPILCAQAGMKYEELVKGIIDSAMERPGIAPMRGRAFGLKTF